MATGPDPLIQTLQELGEPEEAEEFTLDGLPDTQMLWRALAIGEKTRIDDYTYLTNRWYPAPPDQVLVGSCPLVWRPMGPDARYWYVGGSRCSDRDRNGDPDRPFRSLEEALKRIRQPAVGVIILLPHHQQLHAFDPVQVNEREDEGFQSDQLAGTANRHSQLLLFPLGQE